MKRASVDRSLRARIVAFTGLPFLGALSPLAALPIISRHATSGAWAGLATGQAIGMTAAAVIMYGWSVAGPARIARETATAQRERIYADAWVIRSTLAVLVLPFSVAVTLAMAPADARVVSVLMCVSAALTGLSFSWFCVGSGSAYPIALYETLPRVVATVTAAATVAAGAGILLYPLLLIAAQCGGVLLFNWRRFGRFLPARGVNIRRTWDNLHQDWAYAGSSLMASAYASAPVPVATLLTKVDSAAAFASANRLYGYSLFLIIGLSNGLQEWVLQASGGPTTEERLRTALIMHLTLGIAGAAGIATLGVPATEALFGHAVAAKHGPLLGYAAAFLALGVSTPLIRFVLVPERRSRSILAATAGSALIGLPSMASFGVAFGSAGVAAGYALSEVVSAAIAAAAVRGGQPSRARLLRSSRAHPCLATTTEEAIDARPAPRVPPAPD